MEKMQIYQVCSLGNELFYYRLSNIHDRNIAGFAVERCFNVPHPKHGAPGHSLEALRLLRSWCPFLVFFAFVANLTSTFRCLWFQGHIEQDLVVSFGRFFHHSAYGAFVGSINDADSGFLPQIKD